MTCAECRSVLVDVARGVDNYAARLHVRECAACANLLQNQRALSAGLAAAARAEEREPSPELKRILLSQFNWRWAVDWRMVAMALAGAAILVALFLIARRQVDTVVQRAQATAVAKPVAPAPVEAAVPTVKRRRHRGARSQSAGQEPDEPFVPIPYQHPLSPTERAEIVRVNMSVSALTSLGLPLEGTDPGQRLDADLLLGENGLARAWRPVVNKPQGAKR